MELRVKRAPHIDTEITVPGDKSISHRAAIIAALSNGICRLNGFLMSDDCLRTVNALRALGIRIDDPEPDTIVVHGQRRVLSAPSAQGKSAILMAGLFAKGKTSIVEGTQTRDHTERMLRYFFVRTTREENGTISIFGDQVPESRDFRIPGDLSSATYWLAAAAA